MLDGARREMANVAAELLAGLANGPLQPPAGRRGWSGDDFNPYAASLRRGTPITPENIDLLKAIFVDGRG